MQPRESQRLWQRERGKSRDGLVNRLHLPRHVIHEQILPQVLRRSEVRFSLAHGRDFLDELDQAVVGSQHERVDHDAGALAARNFFQRLAHDQRVEPKSIFVNPAVFQRES